MEFRARVQLDGKTATGIEVPAAVVQSLGQGKRPAVRVTINGYTYRSTVASMGGVFKLPVSAEVRAGAGIEAGDDVTVAIEPDTQPREVAVPPELAEKLSADGALRAAFAALSYSRQRQIVEPIAAAKTDETRQRRIEKALEALRAS